MSCKSNGDIKHLSITDILTSSSLHFPQSVHIKHIITTEIKQTLSLQTNDVHVHMMTSTPKVTMAKEQLQTTNVTTLEGTQVCFTVILILLLLEDKDLISSSL
jgi:hypothetical protein